MPTRSYSRRQSDTSIIGASSSTDHRDLLLRDSLHARPIASAARMASATMSGVTSNGSLWMVSPGAVARRAIGASRSRGILVRPMSANVIGSPTSDEKPSTSLHSRARGSFENQLHQKAEGDLFTVEIRVGLMRGGQAVVDGMGRCQPRRLEAEAREQGICLDQPFEGGGDGLSRDSLEGSGPISQERPVAELGQRQGARC